MNKLLKTILLGALLCLQGCMTYWANPGGRNWDTDLRTCTAQSVTNVCRTTNQVSNSVCKRWPNGETHCQEVTTPSQKICGPEENTQVKEACLQGIGWRKTDKQGSMAAQLASTYPNRQAQLDDLKSKRDAMCRDPKFAPIVSKSPCDSANYKAQHLSDTSKITSEQRPLMQEFWDEERKRSAQWESIAGQGLNPKAWSQLMDYRYSVQKPASTENYQALLDGKITWGQFNTRDKQIAEATRAWRPTP
jgi:hypothetical protein